MHGLLNTTSGVNPVWLALRTTLVGVDKGAGLHSCNPALKIVHSLQSRIRSLPSYTQLSTLVLPQGAARGGSRLLPGQQARTDILLRHGVVHNGAEQTLLLQEDQGNLCGGLFVARVQDTVGSDLYPGI